MKTLLTQLINPPGVSGFENQGISNFIYRWAKNKKIKTKIDALGNLLLTKGRGKKTILLEAHLDEVGFLVSQIINKSTAQLIPVGSINPQSIINNQVIINKTLGIINKNFKLKINTQNLNIGDLVCFNKKIKFNKNFITAPALDNRVSCAVLLNLINKIKLPKNVTLKILLSTQHEQGSPLNIYSWLTKLKPNFIIICDSAYARPDGQTNWHIPKLGQGPVLQLIGNNFIVNRKLIQKIKNIFPWQYEIPDPDQGGTQASRIPNSVPFIVVNIPVQNQHTANSKANLQDLIAAEKAIKKIISVL